MSAYNLFLNGENNMCYHNIPTLIRLLISLTFNIKPGLSGYTIDIGSYIGSTGDKVHCWIIILQNI